MCCVLSVLLLVGPRLAIIVWFLIDSMRWSIVYGNNMVLPILGFFLLPWTTLAYTLVAPGGMDGFKWLIVLVVFLLDIGAVGGGYRERKRFA